MSIDSDLIPIYHVYIMSIKLKFTNQDLYQSHALLEKGSLVVPFYLLIFIKYQFVHTSHALFNR